ncbi:HIRAN domain-containing protein [Lutimonas vermicola]|uniref:HIRAN domain-containing protein n=1 Tax=Lutimonas vermicola TaxID=414288 RepID=A0ABU9L0G7_9FLAO
MKLSFLNKINSFFKKNEDVILKDKDLSKPDSHAISMWTAGLNYESRNQAVLKCHLRENVKLRRESENLIDQNAIHVQRMDGSSLGYVGRYRAAILAPLIDSKAIKPEAVIAGLKCDVTNDIYGVKITLNIESSIYNELHFNKEEIEFLFTTSENENFYLLLECEDFTLDKIISLFDKNKIDYKRTGISYRPGNDGKMYSWFILLEKSIDTVLIEKLLRDNFPVLEEKYKKIVEHEYVELQEEEIDALKTVNQRLDKKVKSLEKREEKSKRILNRYSNQFRNIIEVVLPDVEFLDGSLDILESEIEDFTNPIDKIIKINTDHQFKGKKITTLDKWWEVHFNTGQRDDGRLYFYRNSNKLTVLVSFKKDQKRDILYLQKYN